MREKFEKLWLRVRLHEVRPGIPSERIVIKGFSMGDALAFSAGFTCDKSLAGIIGLSSFLMQNSEAPGNTSEARTYLLQMREDVAVDEADEEMLEESKRLLQSIANTHHDLVEQTAKEMSFAESSSEEEELNSAIEAAD
ncbi:Acyl-protein thioesterase 2 [Toxocara canis]|uniref:palmitoyl-protein hydrolase n=1 Tax=Toxocara canis TaxID=6265 RepID=A0A0B2V566_TOXCA|nr:Acyl-protein thioesterase 2 [Toxocara canis]